jgi:hypothetical protein
MKGVRVPLIAGMDTDGCASFEHVIILIGEMHERICLFCF